MFIRSERLFLRPAWPEDCEELIALAADESVARGISSTNWPTAAQEARRSIARRGERLLPNFCITLPTADGARPIGSIGLFRAAEDVELGYWIGRRHWGQGYATEATRAVLGLARAIGHRRIYASQIADIAASARVLQKTGFRRVVSNTSRKGAAPGGVQSAVTFAVDLCEPCIGDNPITRAA